MNVLFIKAVKDVTRRKLRATLTILGIAIGVMGLTAIGVASNQLQASLNYTNNTSGQPDISYYTSPSAAALAQTLAQTLAQQPNVKVAQAETTGFGKWRTSNGHFGLSLVGFDDLSHIQFGKFQLVSGALPTHGEILLEDGDRALSAVKVGDLITVQIGGHTERLRVSGFARTSGLSAPSFSLVATGYLRADDLQAALGARGDNTFLVRLDDYSQRTTTAAQLQPIFAANGTRILSVSVGRLTDSGQQTIDGLFSVMNVLSVIAVLLSVFLLLSTITTLIAEQTPIIGAMKAIGGQSGQILRNYLMLVAIYGVGGTALGIALGIGVGLVIFSYFANIFTLDTVGLGLSPTLLVIAVAVGVGGPLVAAVAPFAVGARVTVRQALSGYGLASAGGGAWSASVARAFAYAPETIQMGMRSLFRQRTRAALTLLALTVSGAAFLAVQTTAYSFNQTLTGVFDTYNADTFTQLAQPASYGQLQRTLTHVTGLAQSEPIEDVNAQTQWGAMLLTGASPNPQLYRKHLLAGRWFTASDTDAVVISRDAADKSHLGIGDSIVVHTSLYSVTWRIVGVARDYNGITESGVLLASIAEVNAFQRLPADYVDALLTDGVSHQAADVTALAGRVDDALSAVGYQDQTETIQQIKTQNESVFSLIYGLLYAVAVLIALVGAIGLFNTLAMSVLERRREIGILRSMGATGRQVAQVFWAEGLTLGGLAWVAALIIGVPASYGFVWLLGHLFLPTPFAFSPISLAAMLVFVLVVATLASVIPVWGAARMKIVQTLRYE